MILSLHRERSFIVILAVVCGIHLGLIGYLYLQSSTHVHRPHRKPVQVQSIQLQPQPPKPVVAKQQPVASPAAVAEAKPTIQPKPKPKPNEPAPMPKKTAKKVEKVEKVEKQNATKPKIAADKIAQVKANLQKIKRDVPVAVGNHIPESMEMESTSLSYEEILSARLRLLLTLPDYGDVKISLTLDRKGKVLAWNVVKAASEENRQYVEKTLQKLSLPAFGQAFGTEERHTFQLILSN